MGNEESVELLGAGRSWKELAGKRNEIEGSPSLAKDLRSEQEADCYEIALHHRSDYQLGLVIKHQALAHPHVIRLVDARIKEKTLLECGSNDIVQIYTEPISARLDDLYLGELQYLVALQEALRGLKVLASLSGSCFRVTEKMVGFTANGEAKVWLNQNFGRQEVEQRDLLRKEEEMVRSILTIFVNRLTQKYNFFSSTSFEAVGLALELVLKNINRTAVKNQIREHLRKRQSGSMKKLSVSDKSNFSYKARPFKRTSIDLSIDRLKERNVMHVEGNFKENRLDSKLQETNSGSRCEMARSMMRPGQSVDLTASIKFSLTSPPRNVPLPFTSYLAQIHPNCNYKPIVRINYESAKLPRNQQPLQNSKDQSFTNFPKEESEPVPVIKTSKAEKTSLLRTKYKKFSEIIERSEEGEETESESGQCFDPEGHFENELDEALRNEKSRFYETF